MYTSWLEKHGSAFSVRCLSFLKTRITFVYLSLSGDIPVLEDKIKIEHKGAIMRSIIVVTTLGDVVISWALSW